MIECSFAQIDEFSANPYLGNPVAMMLGADDLTDVAMQRLPPVDESVLRRRSWCDPQRWSRTTGCVSSRRALNSPSPNNPTPGSAHAWLEHAAARKECKTGSKGYCKWGTQH